MLKLIDKKPHAERETFQEILKILDKFDGFLVLGIKNNKIYPIKYQISPVEIVYAAEYIKSKIFVEGDID